jgi:uncharacterized protein YaiI (UPF0178 family)
MNVIGSRPDGWWRDRRGAMRRLVGELERFAARSPDTVTVVFDGRPFELDAERVGVRFASRPGRDAADHDIAELVEKDPQPEGITVVTSDSELAARVRSAGADVSGAASFRRGL